MLRFLIPIAATSGYGRHIGPGFTPVEFVTAVRLRVGTVGPEELGVSGYCGETMLDASAAHTPCCANSVVGHNMVRYELHVAALPYDLASNFLPLQQTDGGISRCCLCRRPNESLH